MRTSRHAAASLLAVAALAGCQSQAGSGLGGSPTPSGSPTSSASAPSAQPVPNLAGLRLTDAQARLSAAGYTNVEPVDASGQGRHVLNPDNWVVQSTSPPAGTRAAPSTRITVRVVKPTDGAGSTHTTTGVIPEVVCKDLQSAQDALQAAGFYDLASADATGRGRHQLLDRDWVVVRQSVRPGARVGPQTRVLLSVVKYGEPTGASNCRS
jgi:PASTA domain